MGGSRLDDEAGVGEFCGLLGGHRWRHLVAAMGDSVDQPGRLDLDEGLSDRSL